MNFQTRKEMDAPATEEELTNERTFWRQFNGQLSRAGATRDVKFMGILGDALGRHPGDRVQIPDTHFVPPKKFRADCIAPYLSAAESRKEYISQRLSPQWRRKLNPAPYYYDVFVEKEGAERWLASALRETSPGSNIERQKPVTKAQLSRDYERRIVELGDRRQSRQDDRTWAREKYGRRVTTAKIDELHKADTVARPRRRGRPIGGRRAT